MCTNFNSNQFESSFVPKRLQNYEVPHQHKPHPLPRIGHTKIIADDNGHIVHRGRRSPASPWGHFMNTWEKPKKPINLKIKTKLMSQKMGGKTNSSNIFFENNTNKSSYPEKPLQDHSSEHLLEEEENKTPTALYINELERPSAESKPSSSRGLQKSPGLRNLPDQCSVSPTPSNHSQHTCTSQPPVSPPSSQQLSQSRSHSADNNESIHSHSATHSRSASSAAQSSYRPHSRQVSHEGSGIGTSQGSRVYTSSSVDKSTRLHTSQSVYTSDGCNKGIQCPSLVE